MTEDIHFAAAVEQAEAIRNGRLSPVELVDAYLAASRNAIRRSRPTSPSPATAHATPLARPSADSR